MSDVARPLTPALSPDGGEGEDREGRCVFNSSVPSPVAPLGDGDGAARRLYHNQRKDGAQRSDAPYPLRENVVQLRAYQREVFDDDASGILVLHWGRQLGKSYTLAAWAVKRLIDRPGRLVTVLSNSKENGAEFLLKCSEICRLVGRRIPATLSPPSTEVEDYRMELRLPIHGKLGRIKVLAANPRTARGFSGDLILDEFAFHENSAAIWEAAEPILASNPDFLCRIASTGNGRHNMFYQMVEGRCGLRVEGSEVAGGLSSTDNPPTLNLQPSTISVYEGSRGLSPHLSPPLAGDSEPSTLNQQPLTPFRVSRISRSMAHKLGVAIYDPQTRTAITPEVARARALDKRAYDQNYECVFGDENLALLSLELISAAERDEVGEICEQNWSTSILANLRKAVGRLYVGFDVGRKVDLSVITVLERQGDLVYVRAILRMRDMRLPEQEERLGAICYLPRFHRAAIDMTGLGLGLFEYAQESFGCSRIRGVNFASTVPATRAIAQEGRKRETVRVTETMATELLRLYEERRIQQPRDEQLREDLRKPEKVTSPGGRVSIAATRDEAGHADHFWSLALAVEAADIGSNSGAMETFKVRPRDFYSSERRLLI